MFRIAFPKQSLRNELIVNTLGKSFFATLLIGGASLVHSATCAYANANYIVSSIQASNYQGVNFDKTFSLSDYIGGPNRGLIELYGVKSTGGYLDLTSQPDLAASDRLLTQAAVSGWKITYITDYTTGRSVTNAACGTTPATIAATIYPGDYTMIQYSR